MRNWEFRSLHVRAVLYLRTDRTAFIVHSGCTVVTGCFASIEVNRFYTDLYSDVYQYTVIPRLTKLIRSGITFVSRNVVSPWVSIENRLIRSGCCPLFKDKFYKIVKKHAIKGQKLTKGSDEQLPNWMKENGK